jgi:ribosomal protein S18 acetylase RimI-like enzyme
VSLVLRVAEPADEAVLAALDGERLGADLLAAGQAGELVAALAGMQRRARRLEYDASFADNVERVAEVDGSVVGRLWTAVERDRLVLLDVSVVAGARRRGIGSSLVEIACTEAERLGVPVVGHVAMTNTASLAMCARGGLRAVERDGATIRVERRMPVADRMA